MKLIKTLKKHNVVLSVYADELQRTFVSENINEDRIPIYRIPIHRPYEYVKRLKKQNFIESLTHYVDPSGLLCKQNSKRKRKAK
jgi:hypothetical protein